jgi:hypothetical protein
MICGESATGLKKKVDPGFWAFWSKKRVWQKLKKVIFLPIFRCSTAKRHPLLPDGFVCRGNIFVWVVVSMQIFVWCIIAVVRCALWGVFLWCVLVGCFWSFYDAGVT